MVKEDDAAVISQLIALLASGRIAEGAAYLQSREQSLSEPFRQEALGHVNFYKRNLQEAVDRYEAAIRLSPDRIIARYQYLVGTQEQRAGDLVAAFKRYQAAIDAEPGFVDAYVELGGLLVKVKDYEGAAQCFRDALKIQPDDAANVHNLRSVLSVLAEAQPARYESELKDFEARHPGTAMPDAAALAKHSW